MTRSAEHAREDASDSQQGSFPTHRVLRKASMPESIYNTDLRETPPAPLQATSGETMFADYPRHAPGIPPLVLERGDYRLHFAATPEELDEILRLRYDVYNLEMGEGLDESARTGRDVDAFDAQCHHLLVRHALSGECVGTYRLQTAAMARSGCGFYTDQEFRIAELPESVREEAVEVGRACIGRAHRNGQVLQLLWKGLANYLLWNGKRYLFGACSLASQDPAEGLMLYRELSANGHLHPAIRLEPRAGWECRIVGSLPLIARTPEMPRLLQGYLNLGGSVCGEPALDRAFKTIDYLVLLDAETMPPGVFRRFLS
jgi:putative hemolysin